MPWNEGAATDADAIHDNVAAEISAISEKVTPVNADLVVIEDSAAANVKKRVQVGNLPGGGVTVPQWIEYLAARQTDESSNADDDFFDDASVSGDWTELTVTGGQTVTEKYGRLSVNITSTITAGDFNALLRAVSPSFGDVIEIHVGPIMASELRDFIFVGLCFSDGVTATDNVAAFTAFKRIAADSAEQWGWFLSTRDGTFTSHSADTAAADDAILAPLDGLYMRLEYDASNSYKVEVSPDGVSWRPVGAAFTANAFTPTHAGLVWANNGEQIELTIISFDYFRYNPV